MSSSPGTVLQAATLEVRADAFPVHVEIAPGLGARIFLHSIGAPASPGWCWSWVSQGLEAFGQREVVFTLPVGAGGDAGRPPTDPLRFFATLSGLAAQGRLVEAGGLTRLGGNGFMGRAGIAYAPAQPVDGVELPPSALWMVAITAEEAEVHEAFGHSRLLTTLGLAYTFYPYPPWSDLRRATICSLQTTQGSVLSRMPRVRPGAIARMTNGTVSVQLRPGAAPLLTQMFASIGPASAYALLTDLDAGADGCFVWQAGQRAPAAIEAIGSARRSLAGCFFAVVPDQAEEGAGMVEDGFAFFGGRRSTDLLRDAVTSRRRIELAATAGRMPVTLEWLGN